MLPLSSYSWRAYIKKSRFFTLVSSISQLLTESSPQKAESRWLYQKKIFQLWTIKGETFAASMLNERKKRNRETKKNKTKQTINLMACAGGWSLCMVAWRRRKDEPLSPLKNIDRPTFLSTALTINEYPHSFPTSFTYFPPPDNINKALIILAEQL